MSTSRILVIGAGLAGLTTAYTLAKNGYCVTVVYEKSSNIVSQVAAAIWAMPLPSMFAYLDQQNESKYKEWALCSYRKYTEIAGSDHQSGVQVKDFDYVFRTKIQDSPKYSRVMDAYKSLPGFRHSQHILQERGIYGPGLIDCFTYKSPFVDTDVYLEWLTKKCRELGVRFHQRTITGLLADQVHSLKKEYLVDVVINCTGLKARELVGDSNVYPGVGAAFLCPIKDKSQFVLGIDCLQHWIDDEYNIDGHVLIAPRGQNSFWIGSFLTENVHPSELHEGHPVIQRLLNECISVYPPLETLIAGQRISLRVGSRPMRKGGPRFERDGQCDSIIHNYGHGSLGSILSWGSAGEVLRIIENTRSTLNAKL